MKKITHTLFFSLLFFLPLAGHSDGGTDPATLKYYEDLEQKVKLKDAMPTLEVAKDLLSEKELELSEDLDQLHKGLSEELSQMKAELLNKLDQQQLLIQRLEQKLQKEQQLGQTLKQVLKPELREKLIKALEQKLEEELEQQLGETQENKQHLENSISTLKLSLEGGLIKQLKVMEQAQQLSQKREQQLEQSLDQQKKLKERMDKIWLSIFAGQVGACASKTSGRTVRGPC